MLKDTLPARAAPARNRAIAATARVLGSFVALLKGDGSSKERELPGWGFIVSGVVNGSFAFRATGSGVVMGRASIQEQFTIVNWFRYRSIGLPQEGRTGGRKFAAYY